MKKLSISLAIAAAMLLFAGPLLAEKNPELPAENVIQGKITEPVGSAEKAAGEATGEVKKNPELPGQELMQGNIEEPAGKTEEKEPMK